MAALYWADVDLSDGEDVVVTLRRAQLDGGQVDDVRYLVGGGAAAVRRLAGRGGLDGAAAVSVPGRADQGRVPTTFA